jgi:uncharacterized integral membrane protein (TIGR00697 family)
MNEIIFLFQALTLVFGLWFTSRYLGEQGLVSLFVFQVIVANLFVLKQVNLFLLPVTCSDSFVVGSLLTLNQLQRKFGIKSAKLAVHCSFFLMLVFAIVTILHLNFIPNGYDHSHSSYHNILYISPRIFISSLFVFYLSQRLDIFLFSRTNSQLLSTGISQIFDTILFSFFALYGVVGSIWAIIFLSISIKTILLFFMNPIFRFLKRYEI